MRLWIFIVLAASFSACSTDPIDDQRDLTRPDLGAEADMEDSSDASNNVSNEADMGEPPDDGGNPVDMNDGVCQPNRDGVIERSEVTLMAGLSAKFSVANDATWSTAPDDVEGVPTWDLAQSFPSDETVLIELRDPSGQWFETSFPDAHYFTPLSSNSDLFGVYQVTDDEVLLVGVVSPEDDLFVTELEYDPPVPVLKFPLQEGDMWSVESDVSGTFEGVLSVYTETYVFEADNAGDLLTPFGTFPSIRVRSALDREVGLLTTVIRSFAFITECFGTVATVASQDNEDAVEFTDVAELRRIAP